MLQDSSDFLRRGDNSVATMTLMEPGKRRVSVPIFPHGQGMQEEPPVAELVEVYPTGAAMALAPLKGPVSPGPPPPPAPRPPYETLAQAPQHPRDIFKTATPAEWARAESFHSQRQDYFSMPGAVADYGGGAGDGGGRCGGGAGPCCSMNSGVGFPQLASASGADYSWMHSASALGHSAADAQPPAPQQPGHQELDRDILERDIMESTLQEKRELLEDSLHKYSQVGDQLHFAPHDELLQQSHVEAEIEAAGYQAEVAVLTQALHDLDDALRQRGGRCSQFSSFA